MEELNFTSVSNTSINGKIYKRCVISNWTLANKVNDEQPLLPVVFSIGALLITGAIGNGLVCYVYFRKRKTTTNRVFILALAILDFLSCTVVIPFEIYDMTHSFTFTIIALCKLARFSEFLLILASGFTLVAISIDRYVHLCRYKSRFLLTSSRAKKVCGLCVALSAVISLPLLRFSGTERIELLVDDINVTTCGCTSFKDKNARAGKVYTYILMIVFLGALLTMLISYCFIGITLFGRRHGSTRHGLTFIATSEETKKLRKHKASESPMKKQESFAIGKSSFSLNGSTVVFLTVTLVFVIGFVPHLSVRILRFLHAAFDGDTSKDLLYNFLVRSYLLNSVSNPFIYSIIHKRFRDELFKTVKTMLCCSKERRNIFQTPRSRSNSTAQDTSFT